MTSKLLADKLEDCLGGPLWADDYNHNTEVKVTMRLQDWRYFVNRIRELEGFKPRMLAPK